MKNLVIALACVLSTSLSFAADLQRTVLATNVQSGVAVDVSSVSASALAELMNKDNWGNETCKLRLFAVRNSEISAIWLASIHDDGKTPAGWSVFNASNSAGQQFKIASYADVSQLPASTELGIDIVCWQ